MTWPQTDPQTSYASNRAGWMGLLDDSLLVRDLSIPGTHDSAALESVVHFDVSATQQWKVEEQLANGVRFLDLRVKRKGDDELAMWHGGDFIYDPYVSGSSDQLYFRKVVEMCVSWLEQHPTETVIVSVKDEEGAGDALGNRVYPILTQVNQQHNAPTNPNYHGMWHGHTVDCTLGQVRGRLILWKRFTNAGPADDATFPGVDFTAISTSLDNTKKGFVPLPGWVFAGGPVMAKCIAQVQDYYEYASREEKFEAWIDNADDAWVSRCRPTDDRAHLQYLNFASKAGGKPRDNATVLNPLLTQWLTTSTTRPADDPAIYTAPGVKSPDSGVTDDWYRRSGFGVIPLDFPDTAVIDAIIETNFARTYRLEAFKSGRDLRRGLAHTAGATDD